MTKKKTYAIHSTIRIQPGINGRWCVTVQKLDDLERLCGTRASAYGVYNFPETIPVEEAFNELKSCMIKRHEKEIKQLQDSMDKLKVLELPKT